MQGLSRVNVIIRFDDLSTQQAARLGHGYQVDATIIRWSRPDALRVPIGALFRGAEGGWRVFVMPGGRTEERSIEVDHMNEMFGEAVRGLREGEIVVINPPGSLKAGASVKARAR